MSGPDDGVEKKLAVVVVLPVDIEVAQGCPNTAANNLVPGYKWTFVGPDGDLLLRIGERTGEDFGICRKLGDTKQWSDTVIEESDFVIKTRRSGEDALRRA